MEAVDVREATAADVEALLDLWAQAAHGRSISDDAVSLTRAIDHPACACLVAVADGRIVGSLLAAWDGWRFSLYRLAVVAAHRRRGVGAVLVDEACRLAASVGATRVDAMVAVGNEEGGAFWAAAGFMPNPRYVRYERTV